MHGIPSYLWDDLLVKTFKNHKKLMTKFCVFCRRPRARHHAVQVVDNAGQTYVSNSSMLQPEGKSTFLADVFLPLRDRDHVLIEDLALKGNVALIKVKGDVVLLGSETTDQIIARSIFVLQHDVRVVFRHDVS